MRKIVVSRSSLDFTWRNSEQLQGDLSSCRGAQGDPTIRQIALSGSISVVRQLLDAGLLDELHLFVHPATAGSGLNCSKTARPLGISTCSRRGRSPQAWCTSCTGRTRIRPLAGTKRRSRRSTQGDRCRRPNRLPSCMKASAVPAPRRVRGQKSSTCCPKSEMFWLSTVRSDGLPHVTPLPAPARRCAALRHGRPRAEGEEPRRRPASHPHDRDESVPVGTRCRGRRERDACDRHRTTHVRRSPSGSRSSTGSSKSLTASSMTPRVATHWCLVSDRRRCCRSARASPTARPATSSRSELLVLLGLLLEFLAGLAVDAVELVLREVAGLALRVALLDRLWHDPCRAWGSCRFPSSWLSTAPFQADRSPWTEVSRVASC